jgi:hypothetical protein
VSMLVLLLFVALAVYALLGRWSRNERAHVGLSRGTIETTDDSAERAPTLRSRRYGLVGRPDQLIRVGNALIPVEQKPKARRLHQSQVLQVGAQCLLFRRSTGFAHPVGLSSWQAASDSRWSTHQRSNCGCWTRWHACVRCWMPLRRLSHSGSKENAEPVPSATHAGAKTLTDHPPGLSSGAR